MIGPGGVFVIDSKQYRGRLRLDPSGRLWHGRHPLTPALRAVSFEADQAARVLPDPGVVVVPIVAVHGAQVPWGKVVMEACLWWRPGACQACCASSRRCWDPNGSLTWPTRPEFASTPLLDPPPAGRLSTLQLPASGREHPLLVLDRPTCSRLPGRCSR